MTDCVHFIAEMCQEVSRRTSLCIGRAGLLPGLDSKVTSFKWIAGNPEDALKEPFSVVLTKKMAGNILVGRRRQFCGLAGIEVDSEEVVAKPLKWGRALYGALLFFWRTFVRLCSLM